MSDDCGVTPLHLVCDNPDLFIEKIETIRWLVTVAPNSLNARDEDGLTPFLTACQTGHIKVLRLAALHTLLVTAVISRKVKGCASVGVDASCSDANVNSVSDKKKKVYWM